MSEIFKGSFTQQEPIPDEGIEAALEVLRSGRLHRYNLQPGETGEVAALEREFAEYTGARHALAVTSGGYAMATALRALGVGPGDRVLTNAFTLAPVPGAIASVGAQPVFVGVTDNLTIDLDDLAAKADGAEVLMLSHMRGHIADMDALTEICADTGLTLIEDCAHTMGAAWRGVPSGRWGLVGCYSTQTYKHMNSGEGGLLVTDDDDLMARAIMLSGSYMLYERHGTVPPPEAFEAVKYDTPNVSGRMDHLRAAILRPQLRALDDQCARWTERYRAVEAGLRGTPGLTLTERPKRSGFRRLVDPVPAARLGRRGGRGGAAPLRGARGRPQVVRRGRAHRVHQPVRQLALRSERADARDRPDPARPRRHAPAAHLQPRRLRADRADHPRRGRRRPPEPRRLNARGPARPGRAA